MINCLPKLLKDFMDIFCEFDKKSFIYVALSQKMQKCKIFMKGFVNLVKNVYGKKFVLVERVCS